jgi:hypothetical protein
MLNSLLPNLRLLGLPSDAAGADWLAKSTVLDGALEGLGLDLAEEAVYLLFTDAPDALLEGHGDCVVARSVIGPKRSPGPPYILRDWKAAPVWRELLAGGGLEELLAAADSIRRRIREDHPRLAGAFMLRVGRAIAPDLRLSVEAIFHE